MRAMSSRTRASMSGSRVSTSFPEYYLLIGSVRVGGDGMELGLLQWTRKTDCTDHFRPQDGVLLLVSFREDVVPPRIHFHAVVPRAPRPARARRVHVPEQLWVVGDEQVRADAGGRA